MEKRKKMIFSGLAAVLLGFVWYFGWGVFDYVDFVKTAESSFGLPWQQGGRISLVREPCVLDTPATSPVTCGLSCPLVTSVYGPACTAYIEINTMPQFVYEDGKITEYDKVMAASLGAGNFIAAPVGFIYRGGGSHPTAGMQYIAGGSTNAMPWVIGIPSAAAGRTQKLVDAGKYIIALFK